MKAHTTFYDSLTQKTCPATVIARLEQEIQQDLDCLWSLPVFSILGVSVKFDV